MKKRITSVLALVLAASMTLMLGACGKRTAPATAAGTEGGGTAGDPAVTLSFGSTSSAEDLITQAMQRVAQTCKEKSDGSIVINVFPASQLGDATAQLESLTSGGQDMFIESQASYMQNYGIQDAGACSFGVVNTQEKLAKLTKSDLWKEWEQQFLNTTGIATLANNWIRQETVICSKKPLNTLADFKGVKIRTVSSETTIASYNALGFSATPIAFSEVFLSLQQGVVDATFGTKDNIYTNSFYVEAPNILMWGPSCTNLGVWINNAKLQSMTEAQRQILTDACNEAGDWYTSEANKLTEGYVEDMVKAGANLTYLSEADTEAANNTLVELGRSYEGSKLSAGVMDRILAAVNE
ncbi:MAG: TRAP transporter substrate-binding protein [Clostridiales bacterium]|nr:TRAP transporter substrate-binding protein [Clostridiales bacterium]